ncbi:MAG: ribosome silencing factor [Bombilactobacillus mellifer]|nr:ribosome silencing factor [Bombilactobacillus mellifer]
MTNLLNNTVEDLVKKADQKQANNIVLLDLSGISTLADYFLIMDARNIRLLEALSKDLVDIAEKDGLDIKRVEGQAKSEWILLDFGDLVIHIFTPEKRQFYNLERLWSAAKQINISKWLNLHV